jgi:hypothetical protein
MKIVLKNLAGNVQVIEVDSHDTVSKLKRKIVKRRTGNTRDSEKLLLLYSQHKLQDDCTLEEYKIHDRSTLFIIEPV